MMQELKSQKDEEARQADIKKIVTEIYNKSVNQASTTSDKAYNFKIPGDPYIRSYHISGEIPYYNHATGEVAKKRGHCKQPMGIDTNMGYNQKGQADPFYIKNMPDILAGLQQLFPGCSVSHTLLCQAKDGKMYDVAKLDESVLPFVDRALDQSYIVIDWS
jgi:hypothetical protein